MFSSKQHLRKCTPENGTDREEFLSLLVDEYLNSNSYDAKCQVLANLANFGYDPVNYDYIRRVGVLDIFLYVLKNESDITLLHFACAGICNLCIDHLNAEYILANAGLKPIIDRLGSQHCETVADTITILINLFNKETGADIKTTEVIQRMDDLAKSDDKRLVNLASLFLNITHN